MPCHFDWSHISKLTGEAGVARAYYPYYPWGEVCMQIKERVHPGCLEGSAAGPFMSVPCATFFAASKHPIPGIHALHGRFFSLGSCRFSTWARVGYTDGLTTRFVGVGSLRWHQMPRYEVGIWVLTLLQQ